MRLPIRRERPNSNDHRYEHANEREQPGISRRQQRGVEREKHCRCEHNQVDPPEEQSQEHHQQREDDETTGDPSKAEPFFGQRCLSHGTIDGDGTQHGNAIEDQADNDIAQIPYDGETIPKHVVHHIAQKPNQVIRQDQGEKRREDYREKEERKEEKWDDREEAFARRGAPDHGSEDGVTKEEDVHSYDNRVQEPEQWQHKVQKGGKQWQHKGQKGSDEQEANARR